MPFKVKYNTGDNLQGMTLHEADLNTLTFVFEHKLITQQQFHTLYTIFNKKDLHRSTLFKRLLRFEELKLIKRTKYVLNRRGGFYLNLIELTNKGIELLYYCGYIDEVYLPRIPKKNLDHHIGIKQSVIEAFKAVQGKTAFIVGNTRRQNGNNDYLYVFDEQAAIDSLGIDLVVGEKEVFVYHNLKKKRKFIKPRIWRLKKELVEYKKFTIQSYGHIMYYLRDKNLGENLANGFYPDWQITNGRNTFNLEYDMGSEAIDQLFLKMAYYKDFQEKDTQHHTVFLVCADGSITTRRYTDTPIERISEIKDFLILPGTTRIQNEINSKGESKKILSNIGDFVSLRASELDFYVAPLERMPKIYSKTLVSNYPKKEVAINEFRKNTKLSLREISIVGLKNKGIYNLSTDEYLFEHVFENENTGEVLFPVQMKEGNVLTMDEVSFLTEKMKNRTSGFVKGDAKVVCIYHTIDELENDIFSKSVAANKKFILLYCIETKTFIDTEKNK